MIPDYRGHPKIVIGAGAGLIVRIKREELLAGSPLTPARTLRKLSMCDDADVRGRIAENARTPVDVLSNLSSDTDPTVRGALAANSAVPEAILEKLCFDADVNVRLILAETPSLSEHLLKLLAEDENPYVSDCAERTLEIRSMEAQLSEQKVSVPPGQDAKLGKLLREAGWLNRQQLKRLLTIASRCGLPLGHVIVRETGLSHQLVITALKAQAAVRRGKISYSEALSALRMELTIPDPKLEAGSESFDRALWNHCTSGRGTTDFGSSFDKADWSKLETRQAAQLWIAHVLNDSVSLEDSARKLLKTVCACADWDVGVFWETTIDKSRLVFWDSWHRPEIALPHFEAACRTIQFEPGCDLPGTVWNSGSCRWISNTNNDAEFIRVQAARKDNLVSAFAFPVQVQGNVTGVMEFFSRRERQPDEAMLAFFHAVGCQIGQFIERREAQTRLRELQAITASIGDVLVQAATLRDLLQGCAEAMVTHLRAALARIWTVDEDTQALILQASAGLYTHIDGAHSRISIGQYKVGLIASERKPHLTNDVPNDPRVSNKDWAIREKITAFAGHPLMVDGRLVGVMAMFSHTPLSRETISALSAIGDQVALGIQRKLNEEAQQKLACIVESSNDGIMSINLDGVITHWNQASERMYGYSSAEVHNRSISLLDPEGSDVLMASCLRARSGAHPEHQETFIRKKNGELLPVSLTLSPLRDSDGKLTGIAAISRDMSQRNRHEALLATQYAVAEILAESSFTQAVPKILAVVGKCMKWSWGAFWLFDDEKQCLRCFDAWCEDMEGAEEFARVSRYMTFPVGVGMVGCSFFERKSFWEQQFSSNDKYPRSKVAYKAGLHAAVAFPVMIENKVLGIIEFFHKEIAQPDAELLGMMSSVTKQMGQFIERVNAEERTCKALEAERQIAQAIIHRAPAGIVRLDANLAIASLNSQFAEKFVGAQSGAQADELLGKYIFQVFPKFPTEKLIDTVENKIPFFIRDYSMSAIGDPERFWDLAGWPVDTEEGGMILMATEVTDRVKLAEQRDDFVATLTHDLKNPLIGAIRILKCMSEDQAERQTEDKAEDKAERRSGGLSEDYGVLLDKLVESHQGMLRLIANLLDIYRYEGGNEELHFASADIKDICERAVDEQITYNESSCAKITCQFLQEDNSIEGDPLALLRVIQNLLSNAVKFTQLGGTVRISGRRLKQTYELEIIDSGPGISKQEQSSLFERFSQGRLGRMHATGTGLGLYLSRKIVERHGGTIVCESEIGAGTIFRMTFPLRRGQA